MIVLYNGATGGVGRHLRAASERRGISSRALVSRLEDVDGLRRELESVEAADVAVLVQLAARVSVPGCEADPAAAFKTNVADTRATVLEFARWAQARAIRSRVLFVGTGHVYAARNDGRRLAEGDALAPRSAYARSKLRAEEELRDASVDRGFELLVARVFGLVAPSQPENYVLPGLIRRVRAGDVGAIPGLGHVRDYLDARDVCDDLVALAGLDATPSWRGGVVNVCSGEGVSLREMLEEIARNVWPERLGEVMSRATAMPGRPDDVPWIVGDPSRFVSLTGQQPRRIPLSVTIREACAATA